MKFSELGLEASLCGRLEDIGFITPTLIQEKSIPRALRGQDVIGLAQTGTGKTAAFLLPILSIQRNKPQKARQPSVLVLVPTRELATQAMDNLARFDPNQSLKPVVLIGGDPMGLQERALKQPHNIVIATPGRLLDFVDRGKVMLYGVRQVVIDEADRMLDMGFIPEVDRILGCLPKTRQTLLFSATMAPDIKKLVESYMVLPKVIEVRGETKSKESIAQKIIAVDLKNKRAALRDILKRHEGITCVIFCNRKKDIDVLESFLRRHKFKASAIHGGMSQEQRNKTLADFKGGELPIIIASNVLARGVDVEGLGMVVNFTVPYKVEDYIHRIGRTGRADLKGIAYTLVDKSERELLLNIEKHLKVKLDSEEFKGATSEGAKSGGATHRGGETKPEAKAAAKRDAKVIGVNYEAKTANVGHGAKAANVGHGAKAAATVKREPSPPRAIAENRQILGFGDHAPAFMGAKPRHSARD